MSHGLHVEHFRVRVVRAALMRLGLYSASAENLVLGTAIQESDGLRALQQYAGGPAVGIFQMEPVTYESLWKHSIPGLKGIGSKLLQMSSFHGYDVLPPADEMSYNMLYAAAMCRVRYYIVPSALPRENDPYAMAVYWKRHYNSALGKGTVDEALPHFQRACKYLEVP